jgi:hypothetical protein
VPTPASATTSSVPVRWVPVGNGHQHFVQRHQAGPAMTAASSGARIGDTHTAPPRDGVTTMRWPGLPVVFPDGGPVPISTVAAALTPLHDERPSTRAAV